MKDELIRHTGPRYFGYSDLSGIRIFIRAGINFHNPMG